MSYGLNVFLVIPERLRASIASQDESLFDEVSDFCERAMASDDENREDEIEDGAPSADAALRAVIDGGPFDDEYAHLYGYSYQYVCSYLGTRLDNNMFSPFRGRWLQNVDEGLADLGITAVEVSALTYGLPNALPSTELPGHGAWSQDACRAGLEQWEASTSEQREALDSEVLEAVETCVEWMRRATKASEGYGIVGFMS